MAPSSLPSKQSNGTFPKECVWSEADLVRCEEVLTVPVIDLQGLFANNEVEIQKMVESIREACLRHGCFQVINHRIDSDLVAAAYNQLDRFFDLPISQKLNAQKAYSFKHSERFSTNLPWKETLTVSYTSDPNKIIDYLKSTMGDDYEQMGKIFQKYCEAMKGLALSLMELLALSLGTDRLHFKKFYEDGTALMRCNFYPTCEDPSLTLGTGPHRDSTSLTILHQDDVGGLEVFANNKWGAVPPLDNALVIMIGDTFSALTNGNYQSCLHRAVVNSEKVRRSIAFFLNPRDDKVVRPPEDIVHGEATRAYPDFTWFDLLLFTQKVYRADAHTLPNFTKWLSSRPLVDSK